MLEDNLRVPSGVSYMLENRKMMMRLFPELFAQHSVAPVEHYPDLLLENLRSVAPHGRERPDRRAADARAHTTAPTSSTRSSPSRWASSWSRARTCSCDDDIVYMRTTRGPQRVDVIYRRIDDDFLDPLAFRPDSMLGVPGLLAAYRAGRVTLANAIGTGVADDKSIYPYVPDMIRFYLGEEPLLANVPTYVLRRPEDLDYVLAHLPELVVKEVHGAGGYGMLIGPAATRGGDRDVPPAHHCASPEQLHRAADAGAVDLPDLRRQRASRRATSTCGRSCCPAREVTVVPGGLTRVALREGSLVVNSSQGGGTKDTWVLEHEALACCAAPPITSTGCRATSSARRTSRACST